MANEANREATKDDVFSSSGLPDDDDTEKWREKFLAFYETNAPEKAKMVTGKLMQTWAGRYRELYANLEAKYGSFGNPIGGAPSASVTHVEIAAPKSEGVFCIGDKNSTIADFRPEITALIHAALAKGAAMPPTKRSSSVVEAKASLAENGLELSSFTVCARVRPMSASEKASKDGDSFEALFKGANLTCPDGSHAIETAVLLRPRLTITSQAKLEPKT